VLYGDSVALKIPSMMDFDAILHKHHDVNVTVMSILVYRNAAIKVICYSDADGQNIHKTLQWQWCKHYHTISSTQKCKV